MQQRKLSIKKNLNFSNTAGIMKKKSPGPKAYDGTLNDRSNDDISELIGTMNSTHKMGTIKENQTTMTKRSGLNQELSDMDQS